MLQQPQPVVHLPDILGNTVGPLVVLDRNVIEIGDANGHRIGPQRVLSIADLGEDTMAT